MAPRRTRSDLPSLPDGVQWPTEKNRPWSEEQIEFARAYHRAHKLADRPAEYRRRNDRRRRYGDLVRDYKRERGCGRCGERDPRCLDLHHREPSDKAFNVAVAIGKATISWARIEAELAKCDVLCANCHRKEHAEERP